MCGAALVCVFGLLAATSEADSGWQPPVPAPVEILRPFAAPATQFGVGHRGVDLAADVGSRVVAAANGIVSFAGSVGGRSLVVIRHDGDLRTTYEPVRPSVTTGTAVVSGQLIGWLQSGSAHCGDRPCLHFGLRHGTTYLDPMLVLRQGRPRLLPLFDAATPSPVPTGPRDTLSSAEPPTGAASPASARGAPSNGTGHVAAIAGLAAVSLIGLGAARFWPF
jgi:murein DD-endopeptidase MepM/ murein hydrolase activator NlpD